MKYLSYWHDTAPEFTGAVAGPIEGHYDVAVIAGQSRRRPRSAT